MGFGDRILNAAPFYERQDLGFQVDLLFLRNDKTITMCEIKYTDKPITPKIIAEIEQKRKKIKLPRGFTLERALISVHGPDQNLQDSEYFHHHLTVADILNDL